MNTVRRLGVAEAKARLAEVLRTAGREATIIHNRGRDVAVVISIAEYERMKNLAAPRDAAGKRLAAFLVEWRAKFGGVGFQPERARIRPRDAFRRVP